ncbi:MAG: DNA-3-methyladenine glycosylase family protein [Flavisolibacter sp.]
MERFHKDNLHQLCDALAAKDGDLKKIIDHYGYPPVWIRTNSFETLVLTILEQQVSLASAYAAFKRLKKELSFVSPQHFLKLSDETLRNCYFSKQKIVYTRELAQSILSGSISLRKFHYQEDELVRERLMKLKGIGGWTTDIYLLHALKRTDIFPLGDLALVNVLKMVLDWPSASKDEMLLYSRRWQPYRSIATMIFWHYYIQKKGIRIAA